MKRFLLVTFICFIITSCSTKQETWLALGDSITYLNEHQDETGNRITKGYMTRVAEKLPNIRYINKGYNGWTAQGISRAIDSLGLSKAEIYSIFLGTNDWWHSVPLGVFSDYENNTGSNTFYGSYRIILDKFRKLNKDSRIILITPLQRGDFVNVGNMTNNAYGSYREKGGQTLAQFAEAITTIGNHESLEVIDLYNKSGITHDNVVKFKRLKDPSNGAYKNYTYPDYVDVPFNPQTDEYPYPLEAIGTTYDALHPSDSGYEIIANMIIDLLKNKAR